MTEDQERLAAQIVADASTKQSTYPFNKFGVVYERCGEASVLTVFGRTVFLKLGTAWWLLGIKRTGRYNQKDGAWS